MAGGEKIKLRMSKEDFERLIRKKRSENRMFDAIIGITGTLITAGYAYLYAEGRVDASYPVIAGVLTAILLLVGYAFNRKFEEGIRRAKETDGEVEIEVENVDFRV